MTYSHTAHYHYLASALNESVAAFVELVFPVSDHETDLIFL